MTSISTTNKTGHSHIGRELFRAHMVP